MIADLSQMTNVMALALEPGPAIAPETLLTVLAAENSPLDAIGRADGTSSIGAAITQDFGFLRLLRTEPAAANRDLVGRWAALIRWLLAGLKDWKQADDERMKEMAALLVTSRLCGAEVGLWQQLADDLAPSSAFLSALSSFVAKRQIVYDVRGMVAPPIWESEFVQTFQKADSDCNWADIAAMWPRLDNIGSSDLLLTEIVRCLARFSFDGLVLAMDALHQCPPVMEINRALTRDQRLRVAVTSKSERVRFCCAFSTVVPIAEAATFSRQEEEVLSELLVKVATSSGEWRKWMAAFNTYPVRFPKFHRPLGYALAQVSYEAAVTYIDSIGLKPIRVVASDESLALVSACLRAFGQNASPEHRRSVWSYAHQRWRDWRFGTASGDTHLFEVNRSALDFAVASYAYECMNSLDREIVIAEFQSELSQVELNWYQAESDCTTEWNRLLSLFQPYAHANTIMKTGEDALAEPRVYYPFDLSKSLYHRIMFRVPLYSSPPQSD